MTIRYGAAGLCLLADSGAISKPLRAAVDTVRNAVKDLPPRQREAVALYAYGYGFEEAAQMMGISQGAVRSHLARGLSALRTMLEDA